MTARSILDAARERQFWDEYNRVLPLLQAAYETYGDRDKERASEIDAAIHEGGDRREFLVWARSVVPGSFSTSKEDLPQSPLSILPASPGAEAVEELPDWWPDQPAFHGTRALHAIFTEGLCAPVAEYASGDDYGWDDVWAGEVYSSYTRDLDPVQKRRFRDASGLAGRRVSKAGLGSHTSLFWVTRKMSAAQSHGPVLEVNLAALRYYWWFPDEILGEESYVFVMPTDCPQALPAAFREVS